MKFLYLFLFFSFTLGTFFSQVQSPIIQNFTNKVYGKNSNPEIYCVVQGNDNLIFAGTSNGVLVFNGAQWKFVGVKKGSYVTSITKSTSGKIFLGALGEFGELKKLENGSYKFHSYLKNSNFVEPVWRTHCQNETVYFQTDSKIYCFKNGKKIKEILPKTSFHLSFITENRIFVRQREKGLYEIVNNTLKLVDSNQKMCENGLFALFQTNKKLSYFFRDDFSSNPLESSIYGGIKLQDGNYALNTLAHGIYILNPNFETILHYDKSNGLKDNDVKSIFQGSDGNLWLATNNGLSYVEYKTDISYYNEVQGVEGDFQDAYKQNANLYFAGSKGIFLKNSNGIQQLNLDFPCWQFFSHQNKLFVASSGGIFEIIGKKVILKAKGDFNNIVFFDDQIIATGPNGISFLDTNFKFSKTVDLFLNRTLRIVEDKNQKELWIGTIKSGLIRLDAKGEITLFDNFDGLEISWIKPLINFDNSLVFATSDGLQRFVDENEVKKSLPDSLKNNPDFYRGFFEPSGRDIEISDQFLFRKQKIVVVSNELKISKNDNFYNSAYSYLNFGRINSVKEINQDVYLCTSEGIVVLENDKKPYMVNFKLILQEVSSKNKKLSLRTNPEMDFNKNDITLKFNAANFLFGTRVLYRYKLVGLDDNWSVLSNDSKIHFSNLIEGTYIVKIQAVNSFNEESNIISYTFTIYAPWYRTIYAYIAYLLILVFAFYFSIKLSKKRLKKKNDELEVIVKERTREIAHQKEEIEEKHKEITDSINYAERIQNALMMNDEHWKEFAKEHFILFKPRDVVSGDFYWTYQNEDVAIWAVADCTGHGVPGAFMSMLGIGFLNEIVIEGKNWEPREILNLLRQKIIKALEQKGSTEERKDGMDISLCCWDKKKNVIKFSGANNPLILITQNEEKAISLNDEKMIILKNHFLVTVSADKMPVGKYVQEEKDFTQKEFILDKEDVFYSFSDGFQDQFGGADGKKFMIKRFKQMLLKNVNTPFFEQEKEFESEFNSWIKEGNTEQIDDVCVVGVRLIN